jgi:hypothetical protein
MESPSKGVWVVLAFSWAVSVPTLGATCRVESPPHRVTVLELYTSEGCSSCPPADRWLSALPQRGVTSREVVPLAFHVDYWNQLGWPDRFSQPRFSERQYRVAARAHSEVIYTPQLVLDGRDLRPRERGSFDNRLEAINLSPARAAIRAEVRGEPAVIHVSAEARLVNVAGASDAEVWLAAFESGLSSRVTAGENGGKTLQHDFVVRELAGPFALASNGEAHVQREIRPGSDWNPERTGLAVFVQDRRSGEILQAVSLRTVCPR